MKIAGLAIAVLALLIGSAVGAEKRTIALTFDDAPREDTAYFNGQERAARLLAALEAANVRQVVFFCNTLRFDAAGTERIKAYARAGHLIANHSHSHLDLHRVGVRVFLADVSRADETLRDQ